MATKFLFWKYLLQIFVIVSLQCTDLMTVESAALSATDLVTVELAALSATTQFLEKEYINRIFVAM